MDTEEHQEEIERDVQVSELIDTLRSRAKGLKRNALISLGLMFFTLFGSMYIFIYAIQLTEIETFTRKTAQTLEKKDLADRKDLPKNVQMHSRETLEKESGIHTHQSLTADQQFISMILNKIGALLILFFAIKLLVNLYRYNIVLSGYYDSRADILQMVNQYDVEQINTLGDFIAPEKIDFGAAPSMPTEQVINLLKGVTSNFKK